MIDHTIQLNNRLKAVAILAVVEKAKEGCVLLNWVSLQQKG